ncbi:uncharacterized protein NECHADRAFT_86885 [Fusarium vanettenii 77-13-4]|uniref:Uncharacterized protein n=1 Tax=Fusarium vanettenii (strain ATCC MYA-4622 / CBS 123669 / FGSC 9596 / NRRL 45880 / 77-13-4) TaxID=660122 RepID=C7ZHW1_FUSV7|nr:uncharacterized protein NECHADRAFT_86885 [Fusarium vanettenii 77-13-4]EEU36284.1 hypothetical protein NECHADRAFT_86885 [Fusarium vanettenii 77-13-4]
MHLISWETLAGDTDQIKIRLQRDTFVSDYAILSHRWGNPEDEVSYEDILAGGYEHKKGYAKLVGCCKQARRDGLRHVWIDTCCINKSSSAELSEAIASMFAYYERAKVCYAFLDDVRAPTHVIFFDASWSFLGHKTDKRLTATIERVTGVDSIVLNMPATIKVMSIAKKMSWAARRETTRPEDMAYSLMGIFGVYMPPLYGEGTHAFIRLQEAIMKTSNDQTIFAWTSPPAASLGHGLEHTSTMLALSPSQFEDSSDFKPLSLGEYNKSLAAGGCKLDFATTNAGLSIRLPIFKIQAAEGLYAAFLACTDNRIRVPSAIFLRASADTPPGHFWRTNSNNGPIERGDQWWFSLSGRHELAAQDIYVLPRFTSVSEQNIEPTWGKVDMGQIKGTILQRFNLPSQLAPTRVLDHLHHVPDPGIDQLKTLRQVRQSVDTQQVNRLIDLADFRLRFSIATLPSRMASFHGREDVLHGLMDIFFPTKRNATRCPVICTLSGLEGIGKTQTAVEFSHHCVENHVFGTVLWVQADSYESLMRGFLNIALKFDLAQVQSSDDGIIKAVKLWLSDLDQHRGLLGGMAHSAKWLLVFDNADDYSLVMPFLPLNGPGCVLLTTRHSRLWFTTGAEDIALKPFTIQESSDMLKKRTKMDGDFRVISNHLGGLPLALERAADRIVRRELSVKELTQSFDQTNDRPPHPGHQYTLSVVWERMSSGISSSSLTALQIISSLASGFTRDSVLVLSQSFPLQGFPRRESDLIQCLQERHRKAAITRSAIRHKLQAHMHFQQVVKGRRKPDERREAPAAALISSFWAKKTGFQDGIFEASKGDRSLINASRYLKHQATTPQRKRPELTLTDTLYLS